MYTKMLRLTETNKDAKYFLLISYIGDTYVICDI